MAFLYWNGPLLAVITHSLLLFLRILASKLRYWIIMVRHIVFLQSPLQSNAGITAPYSSCWPCLNQRNLQLISRMWMLNQKLDVTNLHITYRCQCTIVFMIIMFYELHLFGPKWSIKTYYYYGPSKYSNTKSTLRDGNIHVVTKIFLFFIYNAGYVR